jgi:hypothetical protein
MILITCPSRPLQSHRHPQAQLLEDGLDCLVSLKEFIFFVNVDGDAEFHWLKLILASLDDPQHQPSLDTAYIVLTLSWELLASSIAFRGILRTPAPLTKLRAHLSPPYLSLSITDTYLRRYKRPAYLLTSGIG